MKLNWAERWVVNNPLRVYQQQIELYFLKKNVHLPSKASVLEIGCGRGAGAALILQHFRPALLHAFDVDQTMIAKATKYLSAKQRNRIVLSVSDIVKIPHKNQTLDAIFVFGVLHHIPDWQEALAEIARILKPGGSFFFEELYPSLYQNFFTRHFLLHPTENRFRSNELKKALSQSGLPLKTAWEIKGVGILGISEKQRI